MHNGYFYPQDVKITTVNGIRYAEVDFTLPTIWDDNSIAVAKKCYLSGWEMARRAHEDHEQNIWAKRVHPAYYAEKMAAKDCHKKGMSVSAFCIYWEGLKKDRTEYQKIIDYYISIG